MKLSKYDSKEQIHMKIDRQLRHIPHYCFTDNDLEIVLKSESADSRYSKLKRLIAKGDLLHLRRGLYCVGDKLGHPIKAHPFELAQYIYGPSYISLESALSFHKLIPEAVYTVTSACSKRTKEFDTPLGRFSYLHLPVENLYVEVELIKEGGYSFFMAKPWKAICDFVYCYKKNWSDLKPLSESMRINVEDLPVLKDNEVEKLEEYYHHSRISRFLKGIRP